MRIKTYVFDTSALMRYLDEEEGQLRVAELLQAGRNGRCLLMISAVNWGELYYSVLRKHGLPRAELLPFIFSDPFFQIVPATSVRAESAGVILLKYGMGYADCFGLELASDSPDHILITADYGAKPAEQDVRIEFLLPKLKPPA